MRLLAHTASLALAATAVVTASALDAQEKPPRIPLAPGVVFVSALRFPDGDRESLVTFERVSPEGVTHVWRYLETRATGDTVRREIRVEVSGEDLASAPRWLDYQEPGRRPGYTTFSLSRAVYQRLESSGTSSFQIRSFERAGDVNSPVVVWRGTLTRVSATPEPFPLLLNGRRVQVPVLRARGEFAYRGSAPWRIEFWVLADSTQPLLLKVAHGESVLQTIEVIVGEAAGGIAAGGGAGGGEASGVRLVERDLEAGCRAELPGIYFGFNSAALDPASDTTIASVAAMLARHPNWNVTIEGHTDSVGSAASNKALSERRALAVRDRLVSAHRVAKPRVTAVGFGASRPREPNATIEGRARNRRVELVRP
jgi:outer membrane protein OmpA-like peptidoglycan-associated protein